MAITGTTVHNSIPYAQGDVTTAHTLVAINAAIEASWPVFKRSEYYPSAGTLVSGTFVYSLAALSPTIPPDGHGVAQVFIQESTTTPEVTHRAVWQRFDTSSNAWSLIFGQDLVSEFNGKTFSVRYQYAHAQITAIGDTIYLPLRYLVAYCKQWYAERKLSQQTADDKNWINLMAQASHDLDNAVKKHDLWLPTLKMAISDRM